MDIPGTGKSALEHPASLQINQVEVGAAVRENPCRMPSPHVLMILEMFGGSDIGLHCKFPRDSSRFREQVWSP